MIPKKKVLTSSDGYWDARVEKIWNGEYYFEVFRFMDDNIARQDKIPHKFFKKRKDAIAHAERVLSLLVRANAPGCVWILRGVMLGFSYIHEMEYLKMSDEETKKDWTR